MCCAKLGVTIKQFVIGATIEKVDNWEDKWMLERWARDGTIEQLEKEASDPNRILYELDANGNFIETIYSELKRKAHGL